jgi:hypothetical protein
VVKDKKSFDFDQTLLNNRLDESRNKKIVYRASPRNMAKGNSIEVS